MKWKCKDGSEIEIKDMTTSHLENAINLMDKIIVRAMNRCYESDGDIYMPDDFRDQYNEMIEELRKRHEFSKEGLVR